MKYIRTKDGIYQIKDTKIYRDILKNMFYETINEEHIYLEEIDKEADTIEDLCDEFVVSFDELKMPSQFREWHLAKEYKNVFGAIWTDKGLIYKAKMNNEGKLELL